MFFFFFFSISRSCQNYFEYKIYETVCWQRIFQKSYYMRKRANNTSKYSLYKNTLQYISNNKRRLNRDINAFIIYPDCDNPGWCLSNINLNLVMVANIYKAIHTNIDATWTISGRSRFTLKKVFTLV